MQLLNLLSTFASQYQQRYLNRANDAIRNLPPGHNRELLPETAAKREVAPEINDSYQPTTENSSDSAEATYSKPETKAALDRTNPADSTVTDSKTIPGETDEVVVPVDAEENEGDVTTAPTDTAISVKREATLGYNLTLQFDMAAFTKTIASMADGEITEVDQLAMASFGLSTDFSIKGKETIEIKTAEVDGSRFHAKQKSSFKSKQASKFQATSRDFAAQAFARRALKGRSSIDIKEHDGIRKAVNKFSLRYRSDSSFSFSFAEKFNLQTKQVADTAPESLGKYADSAGEVAATGTNEMMEAFFNAVENYLSENRSETSEAVTTFFGEATAALGFEGTAIADHAESNLTGTIDNFFDSVSTAVGQLRELYLGESHVPEPSPTEGLSETAVEYLPAAPTGEIGLANQV